MLLSSLQTLVRRRSFLTLALFFVFLITTAAQKPNGNGGTRLLRMPTVSANQIAYAKEVIELYSRNAPKRFRFAHTGWREPVDFMYHCSTKWATFLMSLKSLLETGTGAPAPDDERISDWH